MIVCVSKIECAFRYKKDGHVKHLEIILKERADENNRIEGKDLSYVNELKRPVM